MQRIHITEVQIPHLTGKLKWRVIIVFHVAQVSKLSINGSSLKEGKQSIVANFSLVGICSIVNNH